MAHTRITHWTIEHDYTTKYIDYVPTAKIDEAVEKLFAQWLLDHADDFDPDEDDAATIARYTDTDDGYNEFLCDLRVTTYIGEPLAKECKVKRTP